MIREPAEVSRKALRNEQQHIVEHSPRRALGKEARPLGASAADRPSRAAAQSFAAGSEQTPKQRSANNRPYKDGTEGHADKRSSERQAAKMAVAVGSSQEVPPGFGSPPSATRPAEPRRRPAIGLIRSLVATQMDALQRPDKLTTTKPAAANGKPAAESTAPVGETSQTAKPSRRREKKKQQVETAAAGSSQADSAQRAATAKKPGSSAVDAPPGIVTPSDLPLSNRQKKRLQQDQARGIAFSVEETSPSDAHEMPPGLEIPDSSSKAAAKIEGAVKDKAAPQAKEAGKGKAAAQATASGKDKASQFDASRALKQALGPAYFERPVKQQQDQTAKAAESASAVNDKSPTAVADSAGLAPELTDDTDPGNAESAVPPPGPPNIPEQPPDRAAVDGEGTEDKAATPEVNTSPSELQDFPLLVLPGPILEPKRPQEIYKPVKEPEEQKPPAGPVRFGQKGQRLPRQPLGDIVATMPWVEAPEAEGSSAAAVEGSWGPGEAQEGGNTAWAEAAEKPKGSGPAALGFKRYWSSSEVSAQQKVSADEATPLQSPRVDGVSGAAVSGEPHRNGRRQGQEAAAQVEAEDPGEDSESGWGEPDRDANWAAAAAEAGIEPAEKSGLGESREVVPADSESRPAAVAGEAAPQDSVTELGRQGGSSLQEETSTEVMLSRTLHHASQCTSCQLWGAVMNVCGSLNHAAVGDRTHPDAPGSGLEKYCAEAFCMCSGSLL